MSTLEILGINSCFSVPNIPCGQLFSNPPIIILIGIRGMDLCLVLLHILSLCIYFGVVVRPFLWRFFWKSVTYSITVFCFLSITFLVQSTGTSQGIPTICHCESICLPDAVMELLGDIDFGVNLISVGIYIHLGVGADISVFIHLLLFDGHKPLVPSFLFID